MLLSFQTVGLIIKAGLDCRPSSAALKELYKFVIVLAKNEYLALLQSNEECVFSLLERGAKTEEDSLILMDLYQSLMYMARLSMNCNERVNVIIFPGVIHQAKSKWQDRIVTLRALELVSTVMVSADHHMLISEGMLIVLAKCLDVWRFDLVIAEIILTILTTFSLDQWDIREEIHKLNFIQLVKAIEICPESKYSEQLPGMCTHFLKAITDFEDPLHASNIKAILAKEEVLILPAEIDQFLSQGEIVSIYTVDGRIKRMHVQTIQSHSRFVCKDVNSITAKDKYTIHIGNLKKICKGYDKSGSTAFEKGTGWFSKYPDPALCFSLFSLVTEKGPSEFHVCCKDVYSRDRWVDSLCTLLKYRKSAYKKGLQLMSRSDVNK